MILKTFTSTKSPGHAVEIANQEIKQMMQESYVAKEISQSESVYYNTFTETKEFHFTLTVLFEKKRP
jgi:hypothetical protein